jgi:YesN/AraC family two-component response regulator
MYRVVLIDDEQVILEGLKRVVDWERFGCRVECTAMNAKEGAEVIRGIKPDILFTDIKMPDQDGLSLLAGLRSEFPHMLVTVLTGYRDFEYAQQAIHLGVSRFLLKPSKMEEIHEALDFMSATLAERTRLSGQSGTVGGRAGGEGCVSDMDEAESEAESEAMSFVVQHALRYIAAHYAEKFTLADVAEHCYVSQWHLSKLLHRHVGKSFYEIINAHRVERAKVLLRDPGFSISEVCDIVGYNDPAHFSKVFKRIVGTSAIEYRKRV